MKRAIFLVMVAVNVIVSSGQGLYNPLISSYAGVNGYSGQDADLFSFTGNPAALARVRYATAGIYGEKKFLLPVLGQYCGAAAIPVPSGNFGLEAGYYGFSDYHESGLGLAYARKLGKNADAGVQFNYYNTSIAGYGKTSAIGFAIGSAFHISETLHAGIYARNPVGGKSGQEKLPTVYSTGLGYEPSSQFLLSLEIIKQEEQPVTINAGIHYQLLPQLLVRAGVISATSVIWAGTGFLWEAWRADIIAGYHPQLGITPALLLLFNFKKGKE